MQPPPSPTRTNQTHARGVNATSSSSTLSPTPTGNANALSAVSAALQGATLAFSNNQRKTTTASPAVATQPQPSPARPRGPSPSKQAPPHPQQPGKKPATKPPQKPPAKAAASAPVLVNRTGNNGALLAATQAAREHAASRPRSAAGESTSASVSRHTTGGSGSGGRDIQAGGGGMGSGLLALPPQGARAGLAAGGLDGRQGGASPSFIAATLAASRSVSPVRLDSSTGGPVGRAQGHSLGTAGPRAGEAAGDALDTASIPPTTSLVSLFESKKIEVDGDPVKKNGPPHGTEGLGWRDQAVAPSEPLKAKPKPKPKPKPKASVDLGRPSRSVDAAEPPQTVTQGAAMTREGVDSEERHARTDPPPQPRETIKQQPTAMKPKPPPDSRSLPPTSPSSNPVTPRSNKLSSTPRLEPPVPPPRLSVIAKMEEPTVLVTPVEAESDDTNETFHKYHEQIPGLRRPPRTSTSSDDTFVSASSGQSRPVSPTPEADRPARPSRPAQPARGSSFRSTSIPDLHRPPAPRTSTPNLALSSLTNAMVASNLAAARLSAPSSPGPPPVPLPRRAGRSPLQLQAQRTADGIRAQLTGGNKSPSRQQQQHPQQHTGMANKTLRGPHPSLSDDEDARRRAHRHSNSNPHSPHHHRRRSKVKALAGGNRKHAHHEGARRRWRDEITAGERRRYEAVWASNRGLFLRPGWGRTADDRVVAGDGGDGDDDDGDDRDDPAGAAHARMLAASRAADGAEAEAVANVVVRDIWRRSRLPADELAEVWDLVDRGRRGMLGKEEFVVGMWLIDQRLRGRKIPARVGGSVWESAGGGGGVVVPLPHGGKGRGW